MTVRRLVGRGSGSAARLTRVVLVALVVGGFAALGSTALGGSTAGTGATARTAKSALITPARCKRNAAAGTINYISPFGYDAAATIMEVFMAEKLGYFKALCLKVAFNASSFTAEQLVSSGRGQVTAIGSAADHVLARAAGANLTAVATFGDTDPHAIYAQPKIKSLKDFEGGTLGYHINVTPAAVAMLDKAGVDVSKVKMILLTSYRPDGRHARSDRRCRRLRLQRAAPAEGGQHAVQRIHAEAVRDQGNLRRDAVQHDLLPQASRGRRRLHAGGPEGARLLPRPTRCSA